MPTLANALAVMAKAPLPGTVKTRLVPSLSAAQAAELSGALLTDLLGELRGLENAARYLCYAPAERESAMRRFAGADFALRLQRGEELGQRMQNIFTELRAAGHRNVVLIGGDLPALPKEHVERAFGCLERLDAQVVLGPSEDGGYYLVGMNRAVPEIFQGMTWSHDQVLAWTLGKLAALDIPAIQLPSWFDIDTPADLDRLRSMDAAASARIKSTLNLLRRWEDC